MSRLSPADFRASLAQRAGDGRARTTIARGLSVLRGFVRFLERRKLASAPGLAALRAPKLPQSVPKPLTVEERGCGNRRGWRRVAERVAAKARRRDPHAPLWLRSAHLRKLSA